jgi:hypothetical protein
MIVPCNQLVCLVIVDDVTNHFDVNTLRNVPIEYNSILSKILQYSKVFTNSDVNRPAITPICNKELLVHKPLVCYDDYGERH